MLLPILGTLSLLGVVYFLMPLAIGVHHIGMYWPAALLLLLFCYLPMYGLLIAFQDYKIGANILAFDGSVRWVGLANFTEFFNSYFFTFFSHIFMLNNSNFTI